MVHGQSQWETPSRRMVEFKNRPFNFKFTIRLFWPFIGPESGRRTQALSIFFIEVKTIQLSLQTLEIHGGPKFGPLPPPSRDSICMPSQVWSTNLLFEIFDHVINSRRIRRFGPCSNSSNTQVWST